MALNKIANTNLGDSFTLVFNKGNTKTINLVQSQVQQQQVQQQQVQDQQQVHPQVQVQPQVQSRQIDPSVRQKKIIAIILKQVNENTDDESGTLFYKMLDNKLQIDDYKCLNTIITNLNIPINYKKSYLNNIELFIQKNIKKAALKLIPKQLF